MEVSLKLLLWVITGSYSCVRRYNCDARCGFAPPGTNTGTKARIRYLLSSDDRNGLVYQTCSRAAWSSDVTD